MSRLVEVCLLLVAAGILCECERAKGKNSNKCNFKNDKDHVQGRGNFTDYWKKSPQAGELLSAVKKLSEELQKRDKDTSQSTAQMCRMDIGVPDVSCKNIVDCSSKVTERLGLFQSAMEKAQTKITTDPLLRKLVNETLVRIKDALIGQRAIVSKDQNSSVGIDQVCNTRGRFDNEDLAKGTLRFLSEELENYLSNLKNFTNLKGNLTKVLCQKKNKHASTTTSKPLDGQNTRQNNTKDYSNQKHKQTTKKIRKETNTKTDSKQEREQTTKKMKKEKTTKGDSKQDHLQTTKKMKKEKTTKKTG